MSQPEEDTPDDLDLLMSKVAQDPLGATRHDLDRVIAHQRKQRRLREQGVKPKKPSFEVPPSASLEQLLRELPKPAPTGPAMRRRF